MGLVRYLDAGILACFRADFLCNALQHPQQLGVFLFGERIDLQIKLVAPLVELRFMVLTEIGIGMFETVQRIEDDPPPRTKIRAPRQRSCCHKSGHFICQAIRLRTIGLGGFFQCRDRPHIAFSNVFDCAQLVMVGMKGAA